MAEQFRIDVIVSSRAAASGVRDVETELQRLNRTAAQTNGLLRGALQVAGITGGVALVQRLAAGFQNLADTFTQVQNRLAIVTNGTEDLRRTTEQLIGVAERSRGGFEAVAQLYARTALASRELGVEQGDLLRITESVNKAIILSGASAKEANNGLIQLSQAIASNRLGGDELRSVLEQLPVVADVIARRLGVTRGELRELGAQGKITGDIIIDAFRSAQTAIDQDFARTVPTISQAFQQLENSLVIFVGRLNQATGASAALATALQFLGRNLENLVFAGAALVAALQVGPLVTFVQRLFDAASASRALAAETQAAIAAGRASELSTRAQAEAELQLALARQTTALRSIDAVRANQALTASAVEATRAQEAQAVAELQVAAGRARAAEAATAQAAVQARAASAQTDAAVAAASAQMTQLDEAVRLAAAQKGAADDAVRLSIEQVAAARAAATATAAREAALAAEIATLRANVDIGEEVILVDQLGAEGARRRASAELAKEQALLAGLEAQRANALVTIQSTAAGEAQALAAVQAAEAEAQRAGASLAAAQADRRRLGTSQASVAALAEQAAAEANLARLEAERVVSVNALTAAEARLNSARQASVLASAQQSAAATQLAALEAQQAAAATAAAGAQAKLASSLAGTEKILSRVIGFLTKNPLGVAAAAIIAVNLAFGDLRSTLGAVGEGFGVVVQGVVAAVGAVRSLAESIPALSGVFSRLVELATAAAVGLAAIFVAPTAPILALVAAVTVLGLAVGRLAQTFRTLGQESRAAADATAIAPLGQEILANQKALRLLNAEFERTGDQRLVQSIDLVKKKLEELRIEAQKQQGTFRDPSIQSAFDKRLAALREEIGLLGQTARQRELNAQLAREEEKFVRENRRSLTETQREQLRGLLEQRQAVEALNQVIDEVRAERAPDFGFEEQKALLDKAALSAEEYRAVLARLRDLDLTPLQRRLRELRADQALTTPILPNLSTTGGEDPRALLDRFERINREREVQIQLEQELRALGLEERGPERAAARSVLEPLIRENAERARRNDLDRQFLQQQSQQADQVRLALIPDDFERSVQEAVLAQRDLEDATLRQTEAQIRQNLALQEAGGVLQNFQNPVLAQAEAQREVAAQIERVNQLMVQGALTAGQYALAMQELNFRAAAVGTTFGDGLTVAFARFRASVNEAAVAQTALTSAINAAGEAASEFVRTGTVDFRRLALNIIAEVSKIITQLLILKAVQALTQSAGGGVSSFSDAQLVPFTGLAEGGTAQANTPFLVGERGPELFVPNRTGTVVPNDQVAEAMAQAGARGGGSPVVVPAPAVNVAVINRTDPNEAIDAMDTPAGARVLINQISRNPEAIRRAVGR